MATRKDDSLKYINVQLDGRNYSYWSYVIKNFLHEKSMWTVADPGRDRGEPWPPQRF